MTKLIAITGGIGAGKSYVSRLITEMGYKVYDCDSRAKSLMNNNNDLQQQLRVAFGKDVIDLEGKINNKYLAAIVFTDKSLLKKLNSIVHPAVLQDIKQWVNDNSEEMLLFVETAIAKESGIDKLVDAIIYVDANEELRIKRVMARNSTDYESVKNRILNQSASSKHADFVIQNDGDASLVPQLENVIKRLITL